MKHWIVPVLGLVLMAGCAPSRPCLIIPMQLELARTERDQLRTEVETKATEIKRLSDAMNLSSKRVEQLRQERDDLLQLLKQQAADSAAAAGRKK
jgi:hypothetical protein